MKFCSFLSCLTLPVIFLYPHALLQEAYLNYIYILFCGLLVFILTGRTGREFASVRFFGWLFIINLLGNTLSLVIAKINSTQFLQGTMVPLCAYLLSYMVCITATSGSQESFKYWRKFIIWTSVAVIVLICLDGIFAFDWIYKTFYVMDEEQIYAGTWLHRATGSLLSPIMGGMFSTLIITYFFAKSTYGKLNFLEIVFLGLSLLALALTVSRTYFLALGLMLVFYLFFIKLNFRLIGVFCLVMLLVLWMKLDAITGVWENLVTRNDQFDEGIFQGTGRLDAVREAIKYKFDWRCFLWGIGWGQYSLMEDRFSLAHNGFLSIFLPNGLWGVILYIAMFYHNIKRYYGALRDRHIDHDTLSYYLFVYLWLILSLGTFLSADIPVSMFWVLSFSYVLAFSDVLYYKSKHK